MDVEDFIDSVRDEVSTELSRLGSSKSLYADTEGEMDDDVVRGAVADHLLAVATTLDDWGDEETGLAADRFARDAETLYDQAEAVAPGRDPPAEKPAVAAYLADCDGAPGRLGAYVGWLLVATAKTGQAVGFFVGQADPSAADDFRAVDAALDDALDAAHEALSEVVADAEDPQDAAELAFDDAVGTVEAAYDEYFETLEALGVNPKPVC